MDDLADLVGEAAEELAGDALGGCGGCLPWAFLRWVLLAAGMVVGGYLLFRDGAVTATATDYWGAGLLVGSPVVLFLLPWWWNRI
jgi:hypothetical protein